MSGSERLNHELKSSTALNSHLLGLIVLKVSSSFGRKFVEPFVFCSSWVIQVLNHHFFYVLLLGGGGAGRHRPLWISVFLICGDLASLAIRC